jgi:hypothetical protein
MLHSTLHCSAGVNSTQEAPSGNNNRVLSTSLHSSFISVYIYICSSSMCRVQPATNNLRHKTELQGTEALSGKSLTVRRPLENSWTAELFFILHTLHTCTHILPVLPTHTYRRRACAHAAHCAYERTVRTAAAAARAHAAQLYTKESTVKNKRNFQTQYTHIAPLFPFSLSRYTAAASS